MQNDVCSSQANTMLSGDPVRCADEEGTPPVNQQEVESLERSVTFVHIT